MDWLLGTFVYLCLKPPKMFRKGKQQRKLGIREKLLVVLKSRCHAELVSQKGKIKGKIGSTENSRSLWGFSAFSEPHGRMGSLLGKRGFGKSQWSRLLQEFLW